MVHCSSLAWQMREIENLVAWEMARETEVLEEKLPHYCTIHNKSHISWLESKSQVPRLTAWAMTRLVFSSQVYHMTNQRKFPSSALKTDIEYLVNQTKCYKERLQLTYKCKKKVLLWRINSLQLHSLLFCIHHWPWHLFILDRNTLL
jgi:hypothetical protein